MVTIAPKRGDIYDRNMRVLATALEVDSLYAVPRDMTKKDEVARQLSSVLPVSSDEISERLERDKSFVWIKRFLDEKTATINDIIKKKKKQIKLLKEKRAAVINHAVTKGFDPRVKLVGSDIEWLGDTPIDWRCTKIKMLIKTTQSGVWGDEPKNNDKDIKCLRVADFDYEYLTTEKPETIRNNPKISSTKVLQKGDILFEKSGGGEKTPVGRAVLYTGEGDVTCANFIDIVRVDNEQIIPDYLVFFLAALYDGRLNTKYIKQNTGIQNIKVNSYFEEQIPLPTIYEQKEIVIKLKKYLKQDRLIESKLKKSIQLLQELRSSLISHAVTGKIKI